MNIIRLIKIYELQGKVHPIEATFIDLLDGIEEFPDGDCIYYKKDSEVYFYQVMINGEFVLNFSLLWSFFTTKFGCSYQENMDVITYLLEKHLNKKVAKLRW